MYKLLFILINLLLTNDFLDSQKNLLNYPISNHTLNKKSTIILSESINPNNYIVGPGDQFFLNVITNNITINENIVVSPLGDIMLPNLSLININQLSLNDSFLLIKSKYSEKFDNIRFSITLSDLRTFNIEIKGLKNVPFYISVNPTQKVSDLFNIVKNKYLKDLSTEISKRNITLNRKNIEKNIDMLEVNFSSLSYNPTLLEGDIINFNRLGQTIYINGAVYNSGTYEYYDNENLYDFIDKIGGFVFNADLSNISISRYYAGVKSTLKIDATITQQNIKLFPYDHINVNYLASYKDRQTVKIIGEVQTPGIYILYDNMTLNDLVYNAGGFTEFADSVNVMINNKNLLLFSDPEYERIKLISPQNRTVSEISYFRSKKLASNKTVSHANDSNLSEIFTHKLNFDDIIEVSKLINYVQIIGGVVSPGYYPYDPIFTIDDYILYAGGKSKYSVNKLYIINSLNEKYRVKDNTLNLSNGDILFIETRQGINIWNRMKESMGIIGQIATLIAVIQSAQNN